jgi:PLD-like domain
MRATNPTETKGALKVVAYSGDNKILLAMSIDKSKIDQNANNFAGFAIWRTSNGKTENLPNRIAFRPPEIKTEQPKWTPSDQAPFQKFRWVDVPPDGFKDDLSYRIQALYFTGQGIQTRPGDEVTIEAKPVKKLHTKFRPSFTRGYIASQAYADKFHNDPIRPDGAKVPDFDVTPYEAQYKWLGADAREELFDLLSSVENDPTSRLDVFAYDLDVPDVIERICELGKKRPGKVRAVLDNADLHSKPDPKTGKIPPEIKAAKIIKAALGPKNVKQGHFSRYQHNKVLIKRNAAGQAEDVIFGSMNFSIRGMYVQANNMIRVTDATTAGMFAHAFDNAFENTVNTKEFKADKISDGYMVCSGTDASDLPKFSLALSPHKDWEVSLGAMRDRIRKATSSVLFAVMEPNGQGPVLTSLKEIAAEPTIFSYGTVETDKGLAVQSPDGQMGDLTGYAALIKNVPAPFTKEFDGGSGKHIHDKFVVVDFNTDNPVVFSGSSNLAAKGEQLNGDSLAMIEDGAVANMFAIEAVATFDHYHFRRKQRDATKAKPLSLWYPGKEGQATPWWAIYYDETKIQMRDRILFADLPLPPTLVATKTPDWAALDKAADAKKPKKPGAGAKKAKSQDARQEGESGTEKAGCEKDAREEKGCEEKGREKESCEEKSGREEESQKIAVSFF